MFDRISKRYDLLNRLLSLRQDVTWRKKLALHLPARQNLNLLDIATGTADVLLTLSRNGTLKKGVGLDRAEKMLELGRLKIKAKELNHKINLIPGDALYLPVQDSCMDVVTIAFGIRNMPDVQKSLKEMYRVLKKDGRALILEFSLPGNKFVRYMYLLYFRYILPGLGGLLSGDSNAYGYLNKSVEKFPYGSAFIELLEKAGFNKISYRPLTLGIATIYQADKA
ncbi:bifunctional demethylmenaquinone methyltransferase/2-methoxy-6-polyprenyl-1,4-benzoquinol methylase UbiE [candidate division KSB1 bacterium]|nr:bifunctional demethylmenaquinone methyltransferase/2-methoxy-6-polyprenyl-1,4-benzoquinol methylase UbiE [candidate division KSB1 bacterium]